MKQVIALLLFFILIFQVNAAITGNVQVLAGGSLDSSLEGNIVINNMYYGSWQSVITNVSNQTVTPGGGGGSGSPDVPVNETVEYEEKIDKLDVVIGFVVYTFIISIFIILAVMKNKTQIKKSLKSYQAKVKNAFIIAGKRKKKRKS